MMVEMSVMVYFLCVCGNVMIMMIMVVSIVVVLVMVVNLLSVLKVVVFVIFVVVVLVMGFDMVFFGNENVCVKVGFVVEMKVFIS